jgi:hypothetical protein
MVILVRTRLSEGAAATERAKRHSVEKARSEANLKVQLQVARDLNQ